MSGTQPLESVRPREGVHSEEEPGKVFQEDLEQSEQVAGWIAKPICVVATIASFPLALGWWLRGSRARRVRKAFHLELVGQIISGIANAPGKRSSIDKKVYESSLLSTTSDWEFSSSGFIIGLAMLFVNRQEFLDEMVENVAESIRAGGNSIQDAFCVKSVSMQLIEDTAAISVDQCRFDFMDSVVGFFVALTATAVVAGVGYGVLRLIDRYWGSTSQKEEEDKEEIKEDE